MMEKLGGYFKWGVGISLGWLIIALTFGAWRKFWCLPPNEMGDFFAGIFAPLAFLWLVLGYMQQGDELRRTQKDVERQAIYMGRSAFIDFMHLVQADIQFSVLRLLEKARDNLLDDQRKKVEKSRTAYLEGGDREAPVRRAIKLLSEDSEMMKFAIERDDQKYVLVNKIIESFQKLLKEASLVDDDNRAMRIYVEQSIYGELYNGLCLIVDKKPGFETRQSVDKFQDLAV
ncbi:MAG: hypothetical protein ACK4FK_18455 [Ferrovibrio sp.]|uniref:hypothetical protein n=1 Tax=Ferrovibrio sp. TaxID=1917215 RepID=UPI00391D1BC2